MSEQTTPPLGFPTARETPDARVRASMARPDRGEEVDPRPPMLVVQVPEMWFNPVAGLFAAGDRPDGTDFHPVFYGVTRTT